MPPAAPAAWPPTAPQPLEEVLVPTSGERFVFRAPPPGDDCVAFDFHLAPGGAVPMAHCHARQAEVFRVLSGELTVGVDGTTRVLRPGETLTLAPGTFHTLHNAGAEPCVSAVEYRPAGKNQAWFQILGAVARRRGKEPGLLDVAPFIGEMDMYVQGPPRWVQRVLFAVLKPVAIALGHRRRALAAAHTLYGQPVRWG